MKTGTLKELNVKPGDVVKLIGGSKLIYTIDRIVDGEIFGDTTETPLKDSGYLGRGWKLIYRATKTPTLENDNPKLWRDMTPEEKGALLLAEYEGKEIEGHYSFGWEYVEAPVWRDDKAYRIKPEPKVEVVSYLMHCDGVVPFIAREMSNPTHRITFNTIDGKPDPASIKMTAL